MTHAEFRALFPAALVTALLLPSVLVTAIYLGTGSVWPADPPQSPRASVVVWGDGSFTTRRGFKMWLKANGGDYRRWAKNHPHAAARLSRGPRARRAVIRSAASRPAVSPGPTERQAHFTLFALAAGAVALFSIALVRRLPRPSIPALAIGGYSGNPGRLVSRSLPSVPRLGGVRRLLPRRRGRRQAENRRSYRLPMRAAFASGAPTAGRVVSAARQSERFELAIGIVSLALGLMVGIIVPVVLAW